jgi:hypothetical protein
MDRKAVADPPIITTAKTIPSVKARLLILLERDLYFTGIYNERTAI